MEGQQTNTQQSAPQAAEVTEQSLVDNAIKNLENLTEKDGGEPSEESTSKESDDSSSGQVEPLDEIDEIVKSERQIWKLKKQQKDKERKLQEEIERLKKMSEDKPVKAEPEVKKEKTIDDIIEEISSGERLTKDEVAKLVQEKIEALEKKYQTEKEQQKEQEIVSTFIKDVENIAKANEEKFPLIGRMASYQDVLDLIEADFNKKSEEYGMNYAEKNMLSPEKAMGLLQNHLAQNLKTMVQSKSVANFLRSLLEISPAKSNPVTLTNDDYTPASSSKELTEDERIALAIKN
jgi:hypothetical protein